MRRARGRSSAPWSTVEDIKFAADEGVERDRMQDAESI
jgi:hypothetical protein